MDRSEITYPCPWNFRIIGTAEEKVRARVAEVVGERPYELVPSRESAKGTYVAFRLGLEVRDEADRDAIFSALAADESIKMVL